MSDVNIPIETSVDAEVNALLRTTLYHPQSGVAVNVLATDAPKLLAMGFREKIADPESALAAAVATLRGLEPAITRYARGVIDDGRIDYSDESAHAALQVAVDEFSDALRVLLQSLESSYPRAEGAPVVLAREVEKDGKTVLEEIRVDPNQVARFVAEGWNEA